MPRQATFHAVAGQRQMQERANLRKDQRGATMVEFAVLAPVFLAMLMAAFNLGQMSYGQALLNGAVQESARLSATEVADPDATDQNVRAIVSRILPNAEFDFDRRSYFDLSDIGRAESFNDDNDDGACNDGESFTDENGNGEWDTDVGTEGNGGASDAVVYTVTVTYEPLMPIPFAPDSWGNTTLRAVAVRKNQPFADQQELPATAGVCA